MRARHGGELPISPAILPTSTAINSPTRFPPRPLPAIGRLRGTPRYCCPRMRQFALINRCLGIVSCTLMRSVCTDVALGIPPGQTFEIADYGDSVGFVESPAQRGVHRCNPVKVWNDPFRMCSWVVRLPRQQLGGVRCRIGCVRSSSQTHAALMAGYRINGARHLNRRVGKGSVHFDNWRRPNRSDIVFALTLENAHALASQANQLVRVRDMFGGSLSRLSLDELPMLLTITSTVPTNQAFANAVGTPATNDPSRVAS